MRSVDLLLVQRVLTPLLLLRPAQYRFIRSETCWASSGLFFGAFALSGEFSDFRDSRCTIAWSMAWACAPRRGVMKSQSERKRHQHSDCGSQLLRRFSTSNGGLRPGSDWVAPALPPFVRSRAGHGNWGRMHSLIQASYQASIRLIQESCPFFCSACRNGTLVLQDIR
jgi:hypothetical protein